MVALVIYNNWLQQSYASSASINKGIAYVVLVLCWHLRLLTFYYTCAVENIFLARTKHLCWWEHSKTEGILKILLVNEIRVILYLRTLYNIKLAYHYPSLFPQICCDVCQRWNHHGCVRWPPVDEEYLSRLWIMAPLAIYCI